MLEAVLFSVGSPVTRAQQQICPGDFYIFHQLFFLFSFFCCSTWILSVELCHFHKLVSKTNAYISKKSSFGTKIIIWYKKLSFGTNICSYLIGSFQNFLEGILTHNFLGIEVGLKLFFVCSLEWWWGPLKARYLHIKVAIGSGVTNEWLGGDPLPPWQAKFKIWPPLSWHFDI